MVRRPRENDENVEDAESARDEDEEVAGPSLEQVVTDERGPALATLSVEVGPAVFRDGARRDLVAELGQLGGDDLLTPGRVLAPHPPDEFAEICINGRTARWTAGAPAPDETPGGTVPADDGLGFHEQHDVHEAEEAAGQGTDDPAIESAQARAFDLAADDDELLSKDQVLALPPVYSCDVARRPMTLLGRNPNRRLLRHIPTPVALRRTAAGWPRVYKHHLRDTR